MEASCLIKRKPLPHNLASHPISLLSFHPSRFSLDKLGAIVVLSLWHGKSVWSNWEPLHPSITNQFWSPSLFYCKFGNCLCIHHRFLINVFLRVTGKRADGYHELASLFHVISLGDVISFSVSPSSTKDSLTSNVTGIPLDNRNLIIKALELYRQKTGLNIFFGIDLDKRLPTGAGLGGGSGNAATALWAANQLSGFHVSEKELQKWSNEIGSDVPFFFSSGAAYCTGRGEVIQDVQPLPSDLPLVLIKPKEECSTAEVYKCFRVDQASSIDPVYLLEEIMKNSISQRVCINDLEPPAFQVLPSLKVLKERVLGGSNAQYQAVFMSGSGSTIVAVGDHKLPNFLSDEEHYRDVFVTEANFLTRKDGEWYWDPNAECLISFDKNSSRDACRS